MMQFSGICLKCGLIGAISSQSLVAVLSSLLLYRYSDERDCYPSTLQGHIEEYIPWTFMCWGNSAACFRVFIGVVFGWSNMKVVHRFFQAPVWSGDKISFLGGTVFFGAKSPKNGTIWQCNNHHNILQPSQLFVIFLIVASPLVCKTVLTCFTNSAGSFDNAQCLWSTARHLQLDGCKMAGGRLQQKYQVQVSHKKKPGCWEYIGDFTTQLYGGYNKPS